ncbi:MAG TPA: ATP-binding protein [Blastocatellia bacterium]|nr:ATP-binding protein [Blastocatellia bacterium]
MTLAEKVVEITIASSLDLIDIATLTADHMSRLCGFDEEEQYRINLAVRESIANAIEHGNKYNLEKNVELRFRLTEAALTIAVRDHGAGFDPASLPDPLDPENLLNPAGRGILYMRSFMDEVELIRHAEGGMQITMSKNRKPKQEPPATASEPVTEGT